jgi:hypothetical protein
VVLDLGPLPNWRDSPEINDNSYVEWPGVARKQPRAQLLATAEHRSHVPPACFALPHREPQATGLDPVS